MGGKFPARSDIRDMADRCHRRSIRLKGYDYTQAGAYFVTACTHERAHLFGDVDNGMMAPNAMGMVAQRCWDAIPEHMPMVALDEFVVMPNHIHGIIVITDPASSVGNGRGGEFAAPAIPGKPTPPEMGNDPPQRRQPIVTMVPNSLGHIMQTFKAAVSRQAVKDGLVARGTPIWQRGYIEHIIRNGASHDRIANYIRNNPANWNAGDFEWGEAPAG